MSDAQKEIRNLLDKVAERLEQDDVHLAAYMLCDIPRWYPALISRELEDWLWAMKDDGSVHQNDLIGAIEAIEREVGIEQD